MRKMRALQVWMMPGSGSPPASGGAMSVVLEKVLILLFRVKAGRRKAYFHGNLIRI